jgi:hypothetical protein
MARVVIKSGFMTPDGRQEELAEFMCDWPDCPNVATQVLGCVKELALASAVCNEHAPGARAGRSHSETAASNPG